MSSYQLTHDIYRYLSQYQILPNTLKYKSNGNFEIQQKTQQQLQCGYLISKLLLSIANEKNVTNINMNLINSIKNSNTPASRVYNWNVLAQAFGKIGVAVPKERQKEITSGDWNSLVLFLMQLQSKTVKKAQIQPLAPPEQTLDIKKLHSYTELSKSETVLEYILILISKTLNLTPKQAIATLAQSSKYLAHMIVKGIKGSFQEIVNFVQDLDNKMSQIMYLVEKDPAKNMEFLLTVFKPMLISRDSDVAKSGTKLFKKITYESLKYNSKNILYQILTKQTQGFDFIYMGLKRHPYLNAEFSSSLYPFLENNLKDFFEVQLKKTINNDAEYLRTTILLVQPFLKQKRVKEEISKNGLIQFWEKGIDGGTSGGGSKIKGKDAGLTDQVKGLYVELLEIIWLAYYGELDNQYSQQLLIKITQELKRNTRSEQYTISIPALLKLFTLLQFLAQNKNKQAALLYKKLIFLYIENHNDEQLRKSILQNLTKTISKFPTIPLEFLLQPMLKQLNSKDGTTYILNIFDLQFMIEVCKHPKLQQFYAIGFLGYFISVYAKSVVYSGLVMRIIESITSRFCQSQQIREFCLKTTQTSLNSYSMLVSQKHKPQKVGKSLSKQQQIISNQKKSQIIQLIKHFIALEHRELTSEIREKVCAVFIDWYENRNHYDKGLAALLIDIGDIQEILVEFKERKIKEKNYINNNRKADSNNQFYEDGEPSTNRNKNNQSKQLLRYQQSSERGTPQPHQIGLGYKKKKLQGNNKLQLLGSRSKNIKPDPKVLQDIQKIKQKWRLDQSRAKLEQQQQKRDKIGKVNQLQLFQRNLSLGYSKLPQINNEQILFEFDTVKKKHLKDTQEFIVLDTEEDRESTSYNNVIQRYNKFIRSLFLNYASKANFMGDSAGASSMLTFTEVMRLLKDKNLISKIPKIAINEIITTINQKYRKQRNILGGVFEQDFPTFILYLTDLLLQYEPLTKKDEPMGVKVQKIILRLLEGEKNVKQLFDPKLQKLKQQLQYNENLEIPQEFKKIKEMQVQLEYDIRERDGTGVQQGFLDCFQIVDGILYEAVGVHIVSPITEINQKYSLARIYKPPPNKLQSQSVDKKLDRSGTQQGQNSNMALKKDPLADSNNSFTKPLKKLSKNVIKKKSQSQRNVANEKQAQAQAQRDKKREIHAQKLKQQILKLRQQKQKVEADKKQKQKVEEEKKQKKEQLRKQYLEENKRKVLQKKEDDQRKNKQQQALQQQNKEKRKAEVKAKEMEMLEKQRKLIQAKKQKLAERNKQIEIKEKEKDKFLKNKSNQKLLNDMKVSAADQRMRDLLIKNSMDNGEIKKLIDSNKKNFQELYEVYWNWQKQKMQLKNLAQMLKDLETTKYIPPKDISDVYKNVAKGQFLGLQNFIQCIVKLSYKSSTIDEQTKEGNNEEEGENKVRIEPFKFMLNLLHMNEPSYKQTILRIKNEKQAK